MTNSTYDEFYRRSIDDPEGFWAEAAAKLHWFRKWDRVVDVSAAPFFKWFGGGRTNICYNAVDRHVAAGNGDKPAIIWESSEQQLTRIITYRELYDEVNQCATMLLSLGVGRGDRVLIYLPQIPEAAIAMLACLRIGAIHSVVFAGFSAMAIADRITDAEPKVLITADATMRRSKVLVLKEIVDRALEIAPVSAVVVYHRGLADVTMQQGRDYFWSDITPKTENPYVAPAEMESSEPSYILYTSGTTGKPKGVVRDTGGYMVALHSTMQNVYDTRPGDVFWSTSDIGWVVGHSYIVYAPLLFGITTLLYEGTPDYPSPDVLWRIVAKHRVNVMFSAPTAMRMLQRYGADQISKHDIGSLRHLFLAGEPLDESTWNWVKDALGKEAIDHYWSTESGWPTIANFPGIELLPIKPGSPTKAVYGYNLAVVDENGTLVAPGTKGFLVIRPPLPPGMLLTLWGDEKRYRHDYWETIPDRSLYLTGDYATCDADGYYRVLGRADEVINVAGHRLGTREIEEIVMAHPAVAEVAVIGVADVIKGQEPICLAVLKDNAPLSETLKTEINKLVREGLGPIATLRDIRFVKSLPKTRSGKYMRRVLKAVYEGQEIDDLSTLEDGASVAEVKAAFAALSGLSS